MDYYDDKDITDALMPVNQKKKNDLQCKTQHT